MKNRIKKVIEEKAIGKLGVDVASEVMELICGEYNTPEDAIASIIDREGIDGMHGIIDLFNWSDASVDVSLIDDLDDEVEAEIRKLIKKTVIEFKGENITGGLK